jgi:hypothetical protein
VRRSNACWQNTDATELRRTASNGVFLNQFTSATATSISAAMMSRTNWGDRLNRARVIRSVKLTHMPAISSSHRPLTVTQRMRTPLLAIQIARWVGASQCWNRRGSASFPRRTFASGTPSSRRAVSATLQIAADSDEIQGWELPFRLSGHECLAQDLRVQPMRDARGCPTGFHLARSAPVVFCGKAISSSGSWADPRMSKRWL